MKRPAACTASASRWSTRLSDHVIVEVARGQQLYRQEFARGKPKGKLENLGKITEPPRHQRPLPSRPADFRQEHRNSTPRGSTAWRAPNPICSAASRSAGSCHPSHIKDKETPEEAVLHFPGGLKDFLAERIEGAPRVVDEIFSGRVEKEGGHGTVEWAIAWFGGEDGFISSYCNTIPTADGGTHEQGFRAALSRSLKNYAELANNKRAAIVTADDVMTSSGALLSVFIREPEFQGQTKDKLATAEAARIVENAVRDHFDHWLTGHPAQADRLLDWIIERAEERIKRRQEKEVGRKTAVRKLRLPGKLADCTATQARGLGTLHRRRRLGRRLRQAGAEPRHPGGAAPARQDPQRGECRQGQAQPEPAACRSRSRPWAAAPAPPTARTICATTRSSS